MWSKRQEVVFHRSEETDEVDMVNGLYSYK